MRRTRRKCSGKKASTSECDTNDEDDSRKYTFRKKSGNSDSSDEDEDSNEEDNERSMKRVESIIDTYHMIYVINSKNCRGVGKITEKVSKATLALHRLLMSDYHKLAEELIHWENESGHSSVIAAVNYKHLDHIVQKARLMHIPLVCAQNKTVSMSVNRGTMLVVLFGTLEAVRLATGELPKAQHIKCQ